MIALGLFLLVAAVYAGAAYELIASMAKYPKTDRAKWPGERKP